MTDYLHHNSSIFHQETEDRASSAGRRRRPSDTGYTPPPLQPHTVPDGHTSLPSLVLKSRIHSRFSGHNLDLKTDVDIKTFTAINTLTNSVKFPFVEFEKNMFRWPVIGLYMSVIHQHLPVTWPAKLQNLCNLIYEHCKLTMKYLIQYIYIILRSFSNCKDLLSTLQVKSIRNPIGKHGGAASYWSISIDMLWITDICF